MDDRIHILHGAITVSLVHSTAGTPRWVIVAVTLLVNSTTATLAYAAVTAAVRALL